MPQRAIDPEDLCFRGVSGQLELLDAGEVTSLELVEAHLERIERLEPKLNAFRVVLADAALEAAREADRRRADGERAPLLGVPIAVKDTVDLGGEVTALGSAAFTRPAEADEPFAANLRAAGAIVIGKTNLPELAICGFTESEAFGDTRNPWDTERTPGGSSGGSAAGVAGGLLAAATASDGAGSIRIPAACCGLVGLKPGRSLVPFGQGEEHWNGMSVNGFVTRNVADQARLLDAAVATGGAPGQLRGAPAGGFTAALAEAPRELRVGSTLVPVRGGLPTRASDEARSAVAEVSRLMVEAGHEVEQTRLRWDRAGPAFTVRFLAGIAEDAAAAPSPGLLERRTRGFARLGRPLGGAPLRWARRHERADWERVGEAFERHDVLLTPTMAKPPPAVGRWRGRGALRTLLGMSRVYPFTPIWNHLGAPAISIPAGIDAEGMPLAAQLIGRPGSEGQLLALAADLERRLGWPARRPPLD